MDGRNRDRLARGGFAFILALGLGDGAVRAQTPAPGNSPSSAAADLASALERTRGQGVPTVIVATASANPRSKAFYRDLAEGAWARSHRGLVQIVELPTESNPSLTQSFQIRSTPTISAYVLGPDGVACRGRKTGGGSAETVAWLDALRLVADPPSTVTESDVIQARFDGGYPSSQQQQAVPQAPPISQPPPAAPPPVAQAPPPAPQPQPQPIQPLMMVPHTAPSAFVQVPGQDIVVQQAQPRVFLAPSAPVAMGYAPPGAAMMGVAPAAPAVGIQSQPAPTTANLFLPAAVAPAPMMGVAAAPAPAPAIVAAAPAPAPAAVAAAPGFAVTNQTVGLTTGGTTTRTRVRGPGPIRYGLSRFGERLVQLGRTRVETTNETVLNSPQIQGGGGVATFSTASATAVGVPQNQAQVVTIPVAAPPPPAPPEVEYPTPSPQAAPTKGHFLKRH